MAAGILLIICLHLMDRDLKGVLVELPFLLIHGNYLSAISLINQPDKGQLAISTNAIKGDLLIQTSIHSGQQIHLGGPGLWLRLFTQALANKLHTGSVIYAIDKKIYANNIR